MARVGFAVGSLLLIGALLACGISFFSPFWLCNVDINEQPTNTSYFLYPFATGSSPSPGGGGWIYVRGLWAECGVRCQWFWENGYALQRQLFTPLGWHIATQVLYFIGASLVLISVVFANAQMCFYERAVVFRVLGAVLLISFCLQTAAVAVFGAGAWRTYTAKSTPPSLSIDWTTNEGVHFDWCFWMAVAGGFLTLLSGLAFLVHDCRLASKK